MTNLRAISTDQRLHKSSPGMVLLLTLVILALVASWLTISVSRSARLRLSAESSQRELQARWAQHSLQSICLSNAKEMLVTSSESEAKSSAHWLQIKIGQTEYQVCVSDEQSKYNLASKLVSSSLEEAAIALRELSPNARVNLAELRRAQMQSGSQSGLSTYDQLWIDTEPASIFGSQDQPGLFQDITLWGNGRFNLQHASEAACIHALRGILSSSEARRLFGEYRESPGTSLDKLLTSMDLPKETKDLLFEQIVVESACHSVVIHSETESGKAAWRFAVQWVIEDESQNGQQSKSDKPKKRVRVQLW